MMDQSIQLPSSQQAQVTEERLLFLTDCKSLNEISVISLRNQSLTQCLSVLSQCENLQILYLQYNHLHLVDMQQYLGRLQNLQKIDLSFNLIKNLPEARAFQQLRNLKVLYLHDNLISKWEDLVQIRGCPQLLHLTLSRNAVCQIPGYRSQLVNQLSSLKALDDYIVTDEERIEFTSPNAVRFRAMSSFMKILIPKFQENLQADQHLFNLEVDLYRIRRMFERNSPSIRLQSLYRGYRVRSQAFFSASERVKAAVKIQKVFRGWIYRLHIKRDLQQILKDQGLEELLLSQPEYRRYKATGIIMNAMSKFITRIRQEKLRQKSALKIQTFWRKQVTKHRCYVKALNLVEDPRIYFLKEQRLDFQKILRTVLERNKAMKKQYGNVERLKQMTSIAVDYQMVRYPNPLIFKRQMLPILQFTNPTRLAKVKINKGISKVIQDGGSVTGQYLRFYGMEYEKEVLEKLKKRLCATSNEDVSLIPNSRKRNLTKKRVDPREPRARPQKNFDNYQEIMMFTTEDQALMKEVCNCIWLHNLDESHEVFMVFVPKIMDRVAATLKIQQHFRSRWIRQFQKHQLAQQGQLLIYPANEYCIARAIIQKRAAECISQWWKQFKLTRRLEALTTIKKYVMTIDQPTIYLEESIYMHLTLIINQQSRSLRFIEQNLKFDFKHPLDTTTNYSQMNNTNMNESLTNDGMNTTGVHVDEAMENNSAVEQKASPPPQPSWSIVYSNTTQETSRFKYQPVPGWLWRCIPDFNRYRLNDTQISIFFNNFMGIIHRGSFDLLPEVRDFNEIVDQDRKNISLNLGLKFIQINCMSVCEAQKRALIVAILSYNLKRRSFIRMFTYKTIGDGMCIKALYDVWKQYRINDPEQRMHSLLNNNTDQLSDDQKQQLIQSIKEVREQREKQKKQKHHGYILTEHGRWEFEDLSKVKMDRVEVRKPMPIYEGSDRKRMPRRDDDNQPRYVYIQQIEDPLDQQVLITNKGKRTIIGHQGMPLEDSFVATQSGVNWTSKYPHKSNQKSTDAAGFDFVSTSQPSNNLKQHLHQTRAPPTTAAPGLRTRALMIANQPIENSTQYGGGDIRIPGFYYHTSSREPIASVKNIGIYSEQPSPKVKGQQGLHKRGQSGGVVIGSSTGERTTKAGTAWPSTRQQSPLGVENVNQNNMVPPQTAGSIGMYRSSNFNSINGSPQRQATAPAGAMHKRIATIASSGGVSTQYGPPLTSSQEDMVLMAGESQNLWLLRKQREEMAELREAQKDLKLKDIDVKKSEIAKARQVSEVMKHVLKVEQEANMKMYQKFNRDEKELLAEIRNKDLDKINSHHQLAKSVVKAHEVTKQRRSAERDFALNFNQIRNLITKQTNAGEMIRFKSHAVKRNKAQAASIRSQEEEFIQRKQQFLYGKSQSNVQILGNKQAINSTLFDPCEIQEITFNSRIQTAQPSPTNGGNGGRVTLGQRARKVIQLKKDSNNSFNLPNNFNSEFQSNPFQRHGEPQQRINVADSFSQQRVIDYVPNHTQNQFAEISARRNYKKPLPQGNALFPQTNNMGVSILNQQPPLGNIASFGKQTSIPMPVTTGAISMTNNNTMVGQQPELVNMNVTRSSAFSASRHLPRMTFIEEKFPIMNTVSQPSSAVGSTRLANYQSQRYEQQM